MTRRAFSLVELLIVIVILGLLIALLVPATGAAWSVARATQCRDNLNKIHQGFALHTAALESRGGGATALYPTARAWPAVPFNVIQEESTFVCPETDGKTSIVFRSSSSDLLSGLVYVHRTRNFEVAFDDAAHQGLGGMNLGTREGKDERGNYIEIGLDDNSPVTANYMDNDGHDGLIRIYEEPNGQIVAVLVKYSCGEPNCVLYNDEPLFVAPADNAAPGGTYYGWLGPGTSKNGLEATLGAQMTGDCTYGIHHRAHQLHTGVHKVLVMDFGVSILEPEWAEFQQVLSASARHLGRLNVLFSDGSVGCLGVSELDPLMPGNSEELWRL